MPFFSTALLPDPAFHYPLPLFTSDVTWEIAHGCQPVCEMLYRRQGNRIADDGAKRGAAVHPSNDTILDQSESHALVASTVARYLARVGVWRR